MGDEIAHEVEQGVKQVAEHVGTRLGPKLKEFFESTKDKAVKMAEDAAKTEEKNTHAIEDIMKDGEQSASKDAERAAQGLGRDGEGGRGLGGGERGGGKDADGVGSCPYGRDPVDLVSGQMIMWATDLRLPGLLPLVLRRAYASDYVGGRLFGPGWSSTLDQRLEIDDEGVHYAGDDGQILHYAPPRPGTSVPPADGARWPLSYDRHSDTYAIEAPESGWTRYFGPAPAGPTPRPITALADRNGHRITYAYDEAGRPIAIGHSGGYRVGVDTTYTGGGYRVETLRLLDGTDNGNGTKVMEYRYDRLGRLSAEVDSSGVPYVYEYDDRDRITGWTDRIGFRYDYQYGEDGRVVSAIGQDGYLSGSFEYDTANRVTRAVDSEGHVSETHYDEHNRLYKTVDPLGNATVTERDRHGRLLSITDPLGQSTRFTLDGNGDPIRVDRPDGTHSSTVYDERWRLPAVVTSPGGVVWRHAYDDRGNLIATTDPAGNVATSVLDERGHLVEVVDVAGQRWRYESDGAGRPLAVTDPADLTTRYTMDAFGRVASVTDPRGGVTRLGWTVEGELAWQEGADGSRNEFAHDAAGNLVESLDAAGGRAVFEVGPMGVLVARTDHDGARYEFAYTTELRLAKVTNPAGLGWDYEYDAAGNLVRETDFTGRSVTYVHDAAGGTVARTDQSAPTVEIVRDAMGRPVAQRVEGEPAVEFEYDPAGRLRRASDGTVEITYTRDVMGRPITETVDGQTLHHEYDALGRRVRRLTPSGVESVWRFTPAGREASMAGTSGSVSFAYDQYGLETTRFLGPGAALTQTFDELGRLQGQGIWAFDARTDAEPGEPQYRPLQQRGYRYRADGVVVAIDDQLRGNRTYQLSAAGRVTAVDAATWAERYAYDRLGNLTAAQSGQDSDTSGDRVSDGVLLRSAGRTSYEYDEQGRLVRSVRRTLSGRRLEWTYTWDGFGRLAAATTPDAGRWQYRYDPLGRRIGKRRLGEDGAVSAETEFSWEGTRLAEQRQVGADRRSVTATAWDYRRGNGHPLAQTSRSWLLDAPDEVVDGRFHAIVTDLVGTPTELVTSDGRIAWHQTTSLWGEQLGVSAQDGVDCPLRFPGQYQDPETGLHYNVHRYYDPAAARYLSPDPLGLPPSPNNYGYVGNPLVFSDPEGLAGHRNPAGSPGGGGGRFARDPLNPPTGNNRTTEYPKDYWDSTHEHMVRNFTTQAADPTQAKDAAGWPVDSSGNRIPRENLTWLDGDSNELDLATGGGLTYDHEPPVVEHWINEGFDQSYAEREAWYNKTDGMTPMTRVENGRKGALEERRYADQAPGPNYGCKS
ncbi:MAG: RHS repeat-associated core domain-containing protein [Actinocrinis sp.]